MYKHHELKFGEKLVSYAQNAEDLRLYGYFYKFRKPGLYVDVGANHPFHDSVTQFFYLRQWSGINIEPQADLCALLKTFRPRDTNLQIGLSDKQEVKTLRKYLSDGLSTYSDEYKASYEAADVRGTKEYIETKNVLSTLEAVLHKHTRGKQIHFLKVDVEGFEYKVLRGNDWGSFRPWVICVEATGRDKRWEALLLNADYEGHIFDGLNSFYVAKERHKLIEDYRAFTASEFVRYDLLNSLPIKVFGLIGAVKRKILRHR